MKTSSPLTTAAAIAALVLGVATQATAQQIVEIENIHSGEVLENNKLFVPAGNGPFPAVVVMHGSGGLWKNDNVAGGVMSNHFEEWAASFVDAGYIALFVDSYTPRGQVEFRSKRPSDKPAVDDALCSDRHVRPTDAYSALAFLQARPDVIDDRVALMGFSHGGQSTLASVVSPSILAHKATWKVTREVLQGDGTYKNQLVTTTAPLAVDPADGFRTAIAYYPGGGFHSFFGSSSSTASKLYMPYCPTLMIHGDLDPLYADDLYPVALKGKSASHANLIGRPVEAFPIDDANKQPVTGNNPLVHVVLPGLGHSFDELKSTDSGFNTMIETRARVMVWLEHYLQ